MFTSRVIVNVCFIILVLWVSQSFQSTCPNTLISNFHQKNCTDRADENTSYYLDRTDCIPKCSIFPTSVADNPDCSTDPDACMPGYSCKQVCGPRDSDHAYSCEVDADCRPYNARGVCGKYCMIDTLDEDDDGVMCMAYHSNGPDYVGTWWTAQKFKPECSDSGDWVAKQCKGGLLGRCMCYGSTGTRLFGEALYAESENMTCACSRQKADMESAGRTHVSLHCDSQGNFEELQCDVEKSICWCAEPKTGDLTAPVVPAAAMKKLPCYDEQTVGSQYLRQCESKKFATAIINAKLKQHGITTVTYDTMLCNADGSYGAYAISSGIAYCTWRDNSKIGTWQANLAGLTGQLTCNCARDFFQYAHSLSCEGSGNYVLLQQTTDSKGKTKYYCVDDDGFAKTGLLDSSTTNCSLYY